MLLLISAESLDHEVKVACNGFGSTPRTNDPIIWIEADVEASCAISYWGRNWNFSENRKKT